MKFWKVIMDVGELKMEYGNLQHYYDLDTVKAKKRNFLLVLILALIPLILAAGYQLWSMVVKFSAAVSDGILPVLLALILSVFVGGIILIVISVVWVGICCYIPLKKLNDCYCREIFPLAAAKNSDYLYVKYIDSMQSLSKAELVKAKVIHPSSIHKHKKEEYLIGQYKKIDFEIAPITLAYGNGQEISGRIAVFMNLTNWFSNEDFVQISCSAEEDVFAEHLPAKQGLEVKKRISTKDFRKGVITAPKKQVISEKQFALLERLMQRISEQTAACFYIVFSQGRVYFIKDGGSVIIHLPLWRGIEKEIQDVERNGIPDINLFVNTVASIADEGMEKLTVHR